MFNTKLIKLLSIRKAIKRLLRKMIRSKTFRSVNRLLLELIMKDSLIYSNIKNFGYEIARRITPLLSEVNISNEPGFHNMVSKPTTQNDIETPWFSYWCKEIGVAPMYNRKLWEFAFTLQSLYENGILVDGKTGIGFGCGEEPLGSYFASKNMRVIISDLTPKEAKQIGWAKNEHESLKEKAFFPDLVSNELFNKNVEHQYIDMNNLPSFDTKFDFCWSICALEHLGSIQKGLNFIENSLNILKPGGIAIHTTEFNYSSEDETIDNWETVLFLRKHFELLARNIKNNGNELIGPDFDIGNGFLDGYIDVPPYQTYDNIDMKVGYSPQLKLAVRGFFITCFGMIIKKSI